MSEQSEQFSFPRYQKMEDENGTDSEITAYVIDFLKHLKSVQRHKEEFMIFYPHWEDLRMSTIQALEELLRRLKMEENIADAGAAAGAVSGVVGFVGEAVHFFTKFTTSLLWTTVNIAGKAFKSGFELAKAAAVSRARKKVEELLRKDNRETSAFLRLGLAYDGAIKQMKDTISEIHQMSWSYSQKLLEEETSSLAFVFTRGGNGNPLNHREIARSVTRFMEEVSRIDMQNVLSIIQKFLEHNPELKRSFRSALQTVPNLISLTRLMDVKVVGGVAAGAIFVAGLPGLRQDCIDLAHCIFRLVDGGTSETQDTISSILERLKEEHRWLKDVYVQLSGTDLCSASLVAQITKPRKA